ncbi:YicC family protein [Treponema parvum]|uniref:YicC family protein n=1 Tax=Treponema parvum TaxID=138851 RepID=A0A975IEK5_9SPIR|nr:DUF1732 domain-containing protein [Treponema parvum]QTQ13902.1 YicC family protein [Treponema parvum]
MTSMTGYAYKELSTNEVNVCVEIRSVNSRFLDLSVNLPPYLGSLESRFRSMILQFVRRGKVDVSVRIKNFSSNGTVFADIETATAYYKAIRDIARAVGRNEKDVSLDVLMSQPGILSMNQEYDVEKYWNLILPVFTQALDAFSADKKREGSELLKDLSVQLKKLDSAASFFKDWQPKMELYFKDLLTSKFKELIPSPVDFGPYAGAGREEADLSEQRIMAEVAAMIVKYTINEEVVRFCSHLLSLHNEIENEDFPGKRIDFICQEINREINTIGSKNQFAKVSAMVVSAKEALENIREQARNVE